jgi:hypothetical protein
VSVDPQDVERVFEDFSQFGKRITVRVGNIDSRYGYICRLRRRLIVAFWLREEVSEIVIGLNY